MSIPNSRRWLSAWTLLLIWCCCGVPTAQSQETLGGEAKPSDTIGQTEELQFAFEGVAWRDVIRWIAEEADLALQYNDLPTGSFTYSDPNAYTHQGAIDRINLFLLPQGYTLVRSGKLLSVINLSDPRSMQQLDALASLVTVEQLAEKNNHDVVKCIFPLGELAAEDAVQELSALNLMTEPAVFNKTNQIMVTDTAVKLKNVKQVLDAFQPSAMDNGTVMQSFALQHVEAEDVLVVARPHLGLATGEMIGIDVSLSADLQGKNIFVTGVGDKVKLIESLVMAIDRPDTSMMTDGEAAELKSHLVEGGNVETVYNVLQTLLAGKSVRLSMDETAGSVVALASPSIQKEIAATVTQLQAADAQFEVIPLRSVDPYFAISLIEEMLDIPDEFYDEDEDEDTDAPKIDADPAGMRLFVRGKKHQIEQIKKIVEGLDGVGVAGRAVGASSGSDVRVFPLKGKQAEAVLETAAKFWRGDNPVILYRSNVDEQPDVTERVVGVPPTDTTLTSRRMETDMGDQTLMTANADARGPAIRCQLTSRGVLLQSDDPKALDQFEDHLRTIAGPTDATPSAPIVFYLKYTRPDDALKMLAELLDGGETVAETEVSSLVNGYVSSSSSILGSLVTSRDGTTTLIAGSITVVADPRLNRLIAQGTTADIDKIEGYLSIIDKDNSITDIETYGTSHVIELYNSRASEVAAAIRDAFANRIAGGASGGTPGRPGTPQQGNPNAQREALAAAKAEGKSDGNNKKQPEKKSTSQPSKSLEPQMTVAVHEPSNSLIVTAPEQLFKEVEKLARTIDMRGEQAVEVVAPLNGDLIELVLQQVLLGESSTGSRPSNPSPQYSRPSTPTSRPSSAPASRSKNGR